MTNSTITCGVLTLKEAPCKNPPAKGSPWCSDHKTGNPVQIVGHSVSDLKAQLMGGISPKIAENAMELEFDQTQDALQYMKDNKALFQSERKLATRFLDHLDEAWGDDLAEVADCLTAVKPSDMIDHVTVLLQSEFESCDYTLEQTSLSKMATMVPVSNVTWHESLIISGMVVAYQKNCKGKGSEFLNEYLKFDETLDERVEMFKDTILDSDFHLEGELLRNVMSHKYLKDDSDWKVSMVQKCRDSDSATQLLNPRATTSLWAEREEKELEKVICQSMDSIISHLVALNENECDLSRLRQARMGRLLSEFSPLRLAEFMEKAPGHQNWKNQFASKWLASEEPLDHRILQSNLSKWTPEEMSIAVRNANPRLLIEIADSPNAPIESIVAKVVSEGSDQERIKLASKLV